MFLRKICVGLLDYTVSQLRLAPSEQSLPLKPQNLQATSISHMLLAASLLFHIY